jgi:hypothetical protein
MRTSLWVLAALILSGVAAAQHHPSQKHLKRKDCLQQCQAEINATCIPHQHFHQCRGTLIRKCQHRKLVCGVTTTTTTTTTSTSSTTTTTCPAAAPPLVRGSLTSTVGKFNYNAQLGLPGANAACAAAFACTRACTLEELKSAPKSELMGLKDTSNMTVTSFWAIDPSAPDLQQCVDDAVGGSGKVWEYGTAHTPSRGEKVDLNPDGTLGGLDASGKLDATHMGLQCNFSGNAWVACCR